MTVQRVGMAILGKGPWFEEGSKCTDPSQIQNCMGDYNEILDDTKSVARVAQLSLLSLMTVVCILSYRWRWLAKTLFYLELAIRLTTTLIPNSRNYH